MQEETGKSNSTCKRRLSFARKCQMLAVLLGMLVGTSCSNDLLTGQPEELSNSIYERLQDDGHFSVLLQLIDDVGERATLSRTGSKTLFAADDEAFSRWFQTNSWGVRNYGQLSHAQKKLLLGSAMINNANLIDLLSNTFDTELQRGTCMRRPTAVSVLDSVTLLQPSQMPLTASWATYREDGTPLLLMEDGTTAPMILFLPDYLKKNNITSSDISILTNGQASSTSDVFVNSKMVVERDIACKNGYIHKVDGVVEPAPNMAQALRQHADMSLWASLVNRFSAPYPNAELTEEYDRLNNSEAKVYELRYYSNVSQGGRANTTTPDGEEVEAALAFDPGWNQYMYVNTMGYDMHRDAGVMLVPTNQALDEWWNSDGRALRDEYGSWENIPPLVLSKLLNVNMLTSFAETVPSKFPTIVNDAKVTMGISPEHVDSCFMCCNGMIYMLNRVFAPSAYSSVSFPALIHQNTLSVIYWAIDNLDFSPYLNSMDSRFSLFVPTNQAMLSYVDPATYGETQQTVLQFYYNDEEKRVKAHQLRCQIGDDGTIGEGQLLPADAPDDVVSNRLKDLLNMIIVVGDVEDGHTFYPTKGGSRLRVENAGQEGAMTISGGWQQEHGQKLKVETIYDMSKTGNGKTYVLDSQMPLGTQQSVYMTLRRHPEYSRFLDLMAGSDLLSSEMGTGTIYKCSNDKNNFNMTVFDNFNYTVYVPTNEAIDALHEQGLLPTWDDYNSQTEALWDGDAALAAKAREVIKSRITNFLRYHVQDNALYIGGTPMAADAEGQLPRFETALLNPANRRFFSVAVAADDDQLQVTDLLGNTRSVVKTSTDLYNNTCREYWFSGSDINKQIYSVSDAVVHLIDGPLFYDASQLKPWKEAVVNQ